MSKSIFISKPIAPEDLRPGMFVAVHIEIDERVPMFICDEPRVRPIEAVRIPRWPCMCGDCGGGEALKVVSVCLPFVLVKRLACENKIRTLDTRRHRLVQVSSAYGHAAQRLLTAQKKKPKASDKKARRKRRT